MPVTDPADISLLLAPAQPHTKILTLKKQGRLEPLNMVASPVGHLAIALSVLFTMSLPSTSEPTEYTVF